MKIHNYTPHPINLVGYGVIPSEGIARLREKEVSRATTPEGITFCCILTGEMEGLPENWKSQEEVFIVSRPVAEAIKTPNVVCPYDLIRDEDGNVVGCRALAWME